MAIMIHTHGARKRKGPSKKEGAVFAVARLSFRTHEEQTAIRVEVAGRSNERTSEEKEKE